MVSGQFVNHAKVLYAAFQVGLLAALGRCRPGRSYPVAGVLWAAQHCMAGTYPSEKFDRRMASGHFPLGTNPPVRGRRYSGVSISERGFSLPEVLIAMAISSVLLLGTARFLPALQRDLLQQTRKLALEADLWQRIYTVAKHLQRAGYCRGSCQGEGLSIAESGKCVIVQWDANNNGVWENEPTKDAEQIGFRLNNNVLETLRGAKNCSGKGWDKMTDSDVVQIVTFKVERQEIAGFAPELKVQLRGVSKVVPQMMAEALFSVTGFNL